MTTEPTNREMAAVARRAAEIIQQRGKATGVYADDHGRVCAVGALMEADRGYGTCLDDRQQVACLAPIIRCAFNALQPLPRTVKRLDEWSDLPTTTEQDIAAVFLKVADDREVAP